MINKTEFNRMRKELRDYDAKRELLIKQARVVLKDAKSMIFSIQRDSLTQADTTLKKLLKEKSSLDKIAKPNQLKEGSYSEACQEFVEAIVLFEYMKNKPIPKANSLKVSTEDYLMGIADVAGELVRIAIAKSIKGKFKEVEKIKEDIAEVWGEMLKFDFRNSHLRRKFDSIKYNLNKLEDIVYDIKMKK